MSDLSCSTQGSEVSSLNPHNRCTHFHLIPRLSHRLVFNSSLGRPRNEATHTAQLRVYPPSPHQLTILPHIHRLESLLPLAGLVHLKTLSLRLPGTKLTNPVCSIASYETFMQHTFPLMIWLDGEKVSGPGSEFYSRCGIVV